MAEVLVDHQRKNAGSCHCGWSKLGHSHPEHQAAMLTAEGYGLVVQQSNKPPASCPERFMDGRNEVRCWLLEGHEGDCL